MDFLIVSEVFPSIQGEGRNVGKPRLFVRLHGCNKNCEWCDSKQTWEGKGNTPTTYSVEDMAEVITSYGLPVVWTGGEPALQQNLIQQVRDRVDWEIGFDIETNGTVILEDPEYFNTIVVSPKCDQGKGSVIDIISKYSRVNAQYGNVIFKLAVEDPKHVADILQQTSIDPDIVYAMPITSETDFDQEYQKEFALRCLEMKVNFSPRLQKIFSIA
jgi:organic radical activating enzyme